MQSSKEKQSSNGSLQDYLSLGYLFLLILGISREVIYYGFLDVNILSYSSVLDVLLSPLVFIASKPIILLILIAFSIIMYYLNKRITRKKFPEDSDSEIEEKAFNGTIILLVLGFFGFFFGTGIGSGNNHSRKIENGDFKMSHLITLLPKEEIKVKLIGNNSQYVFYVLENEKHVTIVPIQGNVKSIEKLPKKVEPND